MKVILSEKELDALLVAAKRAMDRAELRVREATREECEAKQAMLKALGEYLLGSKHRSLRLAGEAVLHAGCGVKPKTKRLGYELAACFGELHDWGDSKWDKGKAKPPEEFKWLSEVSAEQGLDLVDYVFGQTHYDEYSNGSFYRRS